MDDHCHLREQGINKLLAQIELMIEHLSTHSNRYMALSKKIYETHFANIVSGLELVGSLACDNETRSQALTLLDNLRAWNVLVEQVSETLVDISQDLVGVFDATCLWAATGAELEVSKREAMENAEKPKIV